MKQIKKTSRGAYYYVNKHGKKQYISEEAYNAIKELGTYDKEKLEKEKKALTPYRDKLKKVPNEALERVKKLDLSKKLSDRMKRPVSITRKATKDAARILFLEGPKKLLTFLYENPGVFLLASPDCYPVRYLKNKIEECALNKKPFDYYAAILPTEEACFLFEERTTKHIGLVHNNCNLLENYFNIPVCPNRDHDHLKFSNLEYIGYVWINEFYNGTPLNKYATSLKDRTSHHHISNSPHHQEYWIKRGNLHNMPSMCILEMVADWAAMSMELKDSLPDWAEKQLDKFNFSKTQEKLITEAVKVLQPKVEEYQINSMFESPKEIEKRIKWLEDRIKDANRMSDHEAAMEYEEELEELEDTLKKRST